MRSTAEWEALLDTRNATQWWVEQDEGEDDWAIKAAHLKWNFDALMGSAYSEGAADLMATAPEAVAEVVRLRRELEQLRDHYVKRTTSCRERAEDATKFFERRNALRFAHSHTLTYEALTRILEGTNE